MPTSAIPHGCFRPSPIANAAARAADAQAEMAARERLAELGGRVLVCAACRYPITTAAARIDIDGQYEHTRTNPHGYVHRFGCFAVAPGVVSRGVPSKQHTWFAGYFWHIQECSRCHEHLGWLFFNGDHSFYGLLVDALGEAAPPSGAASA